MTCSTERAEAVSQLNSVISVVKAGGIDKNPRTRAYLLFLLYAALNLMSAGGASANAIGEVVGRNLNLIVR